MTEKNKNQYKKTLNLPQTPFPMRANLAQNEPLRLKEWKKKKLYEKIQEKTASNAPFIFHDGPPYANGDIHVGHLLNKVLKDFVTRSQLLLGRHCPYTPGWDCHGLPIEHKVMTTLFETQKEQLAQLSENEQRQLIRKECLAYAKKYIKLQATQMQRLLTLADYDRPYLTMSKHFEAETIRVFAQHIKEGIVYRQLKPVHWSIENQTALADAELEYFDKKDTSVYVKFPIKNINALNTIIGNTLPNASALIWTTTPWTLPANLGISIHPKFDYAIVALNNEYLIIAKDRIDEVKRTCDITDKINIINTVKGDALLGLEYQHPFCDRNGQLLSADYVTLEDGTGLVHTAPGHGVDDYQTGLANQLDPYCPVLADGTFDNSVPKWLQGQHIWKANPKIVAHLKNSGHLLHDQEFVHSYPHDWRSKTPVIFRSTEQWFISVDQPLKSNTHSLREMALSHINNDINFVPQWGKKRLAGMIENRPDWCISRQRAWGLPIPAFQCQNGEIFLTHQSSMAIAQIFEEKGSNAWFECSPAELLIHYDPQNDPDKPKTLNINELTHCYDIFDVWFESGSSWNAVIKHTQNSTVADLYLEGSDQHRGWFHLSLLASLGAQQTPPFKQLLTHGFIVDKNGHKMSKSVGNALEVETLLKKYGAEVARWWVSSLSYENDIKVDLQFFDIASEGYRKIRNTLRFLLSNLPSNSGTLNTSTSIQAFIHSLDVNTLEHYILSQTQQLSEKVNHAYDTFAFRQAQQLIYQFMTEDLSAFYCMAIKDRLYCDLIESPRRQRAQSCMEIILEVVCRLLAPILPHTSEECFQLLHPEDSVHLSDSISFKLSPDPNWSMILERRSQVLKQLEESKAKGIENPLDAGIQLPQSDEALLQFSPDLSDIFGVSRVSVQTKDPNIHVQDLRNEPRCERSWRRDLSVHLHENGSYLSKRDANAIEQILTKEK